MKLLSLWEPWATLMALGAKKIETRSWGTSYRGWLAIQASKGGLSQADLQHQCFEESFYAALQEFRPFADQIESDARRKSWIKDVFPHGHIVAVVRLTDCCPTESFICRSGVFEEYAELDTPWERAFGNYEGGRFGWVTNHLFRLPEPIPYRAKQGLVELEQPVVKLIQDQWKSRQSVPQNGELVVCSAVPVSAGLGPEVAKR